MAAIFKNHYRKIVILFLLLLLAGCPNQMMRDLVEQKLSDPVADTFIINSGAPTSSLEVTLNSKVTKEDDALEMRFRNDGGSWSDWISYSDSASWTLTIGDGTKTVYAEYRDEGHNVVSMQNTIVLNTGAPAGEFYVWGSAVSGNQHLYVNSASVSLCMTISNVASMRFSNTSDTGPWSSWQAYSDTAEWNITGGDGLRTIYAEFQTNAGTTTPSTRAITVDTTPPAVSGFMVNGGDATTNNINAELDYTYTELNTAWAQYLNDGGTWSADEALDMSGSVSGKAWALRSVNGTRTVSVRIKDIAGNVSSVYSDSIYLNTEAPDYPVPIIDAFSYTSTPTWIWVAVDDAVKYRIQLDGTDPDKWQEIGNVFEWTSPPAADGSHTLYVQASDIANNWSATGSAETVVDTEFNLNIGVTPYPDGGTATANMIVNVGEAEPIEAVPAAGYDFNHWQVVTGTGVIFENTSNASTTVTLTAGNATIQAVFTLRTYTLTVQATAGGATSSGGTVLHGVPYTISAATITGYTFTGWSVSSGTGVTIASPASAVTTVTLTEGNGAVLASFVPNEYLVTFEPTGGSTPDPDSKIVTFDSLYGTLPSVSRAGYVFAGWWTGTGGAGNLITSSTTVSATMNHTLYAAWSDAVYVSPSGNSGNSGLLPAAAKNTIADGITAALGSGISLVRISQGTYNVSSSIAMVPGVSLQGGWNSAFTVRNRTLYRSVVSSTAPLYPLFDVTDSGISGVIYEGLNIEINASASGSTTAFRISNNASPIIQDNEIYVRSTSGDGSYVYGFLFYPGTSASVIIRNNLVSLYRPNCTTTDSARGFLFTSGGSSSTVYSIEKNRITVYSNQRADGLRTSSTDAVIIFKNNILSSRSTGSLSMAITLDGGNPDAKIANNTIYSYAGSTEYGTYLNPAGGNTYIINNIFHSSGGGGYGIYKTGAATGFEISNNLTFGFSSHASGVTLDATNTFNADAGIFGSVFASAGIDSDLSDGDDSDYHITSDPSYAYNQGMNTGSAVYGSVNDDFDGDVRPLSGAYDRGADER